MGTRRTPASGLGSAGAVVTRLALVTTFLRAMKFTDQEVQNAEVLVTASPLTSWLREKLGAQKLARIIGVAQITVGSLIAAKPAAPQASAVAPSGPQE